MGASARRFGPPPAVPIRLASDERQELERLARAAKTERRLADRARAILLAADGWGNVAIAAYVHRHRSWVQKWRRHFAQDRLAGLRDRPRGVGRRAFPLQQAQIVALACTPPAEAGRAYVRWSARALRDEIERRQLAALHPSTVHNVLTDADLHPHQVRYWRHALAADLAAKAASVLWYYERAATLAGRGELVVCLDEKPDIQALGCTLPDLRRCLAPPCAATGSTCCTARSTCSLSTIS